MEKNDMLEQEEALMSKTDDLSKLLGEKSLVFLGDFLNRNWPCLRFFRRKSDEISDVGQICFLVACEILSALFKGRCQDWAPRRPRKTLYFLG